MLEDVFSKAYVHDKKINILKLLCSFSAGHVSVQLRNRGSDAYQHSKYGDSLTIERRISADGGSSYRVKSSEGKFNFMKMLWLFIVVHRAGRTMMDFFSFRLVSTWFLFLPSSAFQLKGRIQNTDSGQWTTPVDPAHGPPYRPIPWTTLVDHGPPLGLSFFIHVHTLSALVSYACVCLFLLSVSGKVVSTRRTQVDEIMDHFNIQASCHFITTKLQSMDVTLSF